MGRARPLDNTDSAGEPLQPGDVVRIVGRPDLSDLPESDELQTREVFDHLVGTYKRIVDFDEFGHVHLSFTIRSGPAAGMHSVWIEPHLLRRHQTRRRG